MASCVYCHKMHVCIGKRRIDDFLGLLVILKFCDHVKWKERGGDMVNLLFASSTRIKDSLLYH